MTATGCSKIPLHRFGSPLEILYALAYLGSGEAEDAQRIVVDALTGIRDEPAPLSTCPRRRWRSFADHIHLASEALHRASTTPDHQAIHGAASLRGAGMSAMQQETVALRLSAVRERNAARLLGISLVQCRRHLRTGLEELDKMIFAEPGRASRYAPDAMHPTFKEMYF